MRRSKGDLHNRAERLERECELLRSSSTFQSLLRKIENLSEDGFERTLIKEYFRLHFQNGQVYFPLAFTASVSTKAIGKYALQF